MITHEHYSMEVKEHMTEPDLVCLADLEEITPASRASMETAYRRGYAQGYSAALRDEDGASQESREDFLLDQLIPWRAKRHNGAFETPPTLT